MGTAATRRIAIIGAGLAGLTAARELHARGHAVRVLDKGRGVGGRMSVRVAGDYQFDHGAQYFTARDARFAAQVSDWCERGVTAPWEPRLAAIDGQALEWKANTTKRYVGVPGMNAPALDLARGLEVDNGVRIDALARSGTGWKLSHEGGSIDAAAVLIATPPRQAQALLAPGHELVAALGACKLLPCWAVMAGYEAPAETPFDAAFVNSGPLSWVCRNASKPGRAPAETWVLHATAEFSRAHLEAEPPEIVARLCAAFAALPGSPASRADYARAHRWRYALPGPATADSAGPGVLVAPADRLVCAGDWCAGGRIEGAYLAGLSAADKLDALLAAS